MVVVGSNMIVFIMLLSTMLIFSDIVAMLFYMQHQQNDTIIQRHLTFAGHTNAHSKRL